MCLVVMLVPEWMITSVQPLTSVTTAPDCLSLTTSTSVVTYQFGILKPAPHIISARHLIETVTYHTRFAIVAVVRF